MPSPRGGNLPLGGGTSVPEEARHRGFARPVLPRSHRLVGGRAERLLRLPLQRPRDHPRLCRQQRADLRIAAGARRESHRQAPDSVGHEIGAIRRCATMQFRSRTGRWCRPAEPAAPDDDDDSRRQRLDPAAGGRRAQGRRRDSARAPHDRDPPRERRNPAASLGIAVEPQRRRRATSAPARPSIVATGGSTGNVNFRRMFDPRLTEEYCGLAGMPWSDQDASGELAAMDDRRGAVGRVQPHRRIRLRHHQAGRHRLPVRLCESALVSGQRRVRQGARHRPCASRTGRT